MMIPTIPALVIRRPTAKRNRVSVRIPFALPVISNTVVKSLMLLLANVLIRDPAPVMYGLRPGRDRGVRCVRLVHPSELSGSAAAPPFGAAPASALPGALMIVSLITS